MLKKKTSKKQKKSSASANESKNPGDQDKKNESISTNSQIRRTFIHRKRKPEEKMDMNPNSELSDNNIEFSVMTNSSKIDHRSLMHRGMDEHSRENSTRSIFRMKTDSGYMAQALDRLKGQDEIEILNALNEMSSELTLANDSVAEDPNCGLLIKELIILFDKYPMLPEISMSAMTCLNAILDINPLSAASVVKSNGVGKIVSMTQNIEYIDCAEASIKALEKMSYENPFSLLENNAFCSVLSFIDFFDLNLRKKAVRTCANIAKVVSNIPAIEKFILPAIPAMTSMAKLSGNTEIEKNILDMTIQCFVYIVDRVKNLCLAQNELQLCRSIIQYGLLDNLFEIFHSFIQCELGHTNVIATVCPETVTNILKIFESLCVMSPEITKNILKMNILELIYTLLTSAFGMTSSLNSKKFSSSMCSELFALLTALFPGKKSKEKDRLLLESHNAFFHYFSENILSFLINNVVHVQSNNKLLSLVKLIEMYCQSCQSDDLVKYVNPCQLANILSKMIETKDSSYIIEALSIVELLMTRIPVYYFVPFLREGILSNIKTLINVEEGQLRFPKERDDIAMRYTHTLENSIQDNLDMEDEEEYEQLESGLIINPTVEHMHNSSNNNSNRHIVLTKNRVIGNSLHCSSAKAIQTKAKELSEKFFKEKDIKSLIVHSKSLVDPIEMSETLLKYKTILEKSKEMEMSVEMMKSIVGLIINNHLTLYEIENSEIMLYLCKFIDANFIVKYNTNDTDNITSHTIPHITSQLCHDIISRIKILFEAMNNDLGQLCVFMSILHNSLSCMNCFTLNEMGQSKRIASYFSYIFSSHYAPLTHSTGFSDIAHTRKVPVKLIFSSNDNMKNIYDNPLVKEVYEYYLSKIYVMLTINQEETFDNVKKILLRSIKKQRNEKNINMIVENENSRSDSFHDDSLDMSGSLNEEEYQSEKMLEASMSDNDELSENSLQFAFSVEVNPNKKKFAIKNSWTVGQFLREMKNVLRRTEYLIFLSDIQINFEIVHNSDKPCRKNYNDNLHHEDVTMLDIQSSFTFNDTDFDEFLFEKYYTQNIINNNKMIIIPRASPFLFLLSTLELCAMNFRSLFNLKFTPRPQDFENVRMTCLLFKQAKDPLAIASQSIPRWCQDLSENYPYLLGFHSRYLFFKISSFDIKRSMANLYIYCRNIGENIFEEKNISSISSAFRRVKVKIDRKNILRNSIKLMNEMTSYSGYIEFEYLNETGTGIGPTLEFYSLFSEEIRIEEKMWYKTDDYSLFPSPCFNLTHDELDHRKTLFRTLGFVIARGMYDDRILDIPLNSLFWDLVLDRPITFEKIEKLDKNLSKFINDLRELTRKKSFTRNFAEITYNGLQLADVGLYFTLPGFSAIELKPGGKDALLTIHSIEEYLALIFDKLLISGTLPFIKAFQIGFNKVFPISKLKSFTSREIEENICCAGTNSCEWSYDNLAKNILPMHGFEKDSEIYQGLIRILEEMTASERKKFLLFVTGAPRLPLGGFKNLYPKLTVVKFYQETKNEMVDAHLPSVMTCQNYLKIPDYSNVKILKEKLFLAIEEGSNAFHLS